MWSHHHPFSSRELCGVQGLKPGPLQAGELHPGLDGYSFSMHRFQAGLGTKSLRDTAWKVFAAVMQGKWD